MAAPATFTSWGSQLDLMGPPPEVAILDLNYGDDVDMGVDPLISEDDEEDDMFVIPVRAAKPTAPAASLDKEGRSTPAFSLSGVDMRDVCKCAAAQLDVPWPVAVAETTRSCYQGKRLPLARSVAKQPLPVFPELLEELAPSWGNRP